MQTYFYNVFGLKQVTQNYIETGKQVEKITVRVIRG